jgi:hypothetical protein
VTTRRGARRADNPDTDPVVHKDEKKKKKDKDKKKKLKKSKSKHKKQQQKRKINKNSSQSSDWSAGDGDQDYGSADPVSLNSGDDLSQELYPSDKECELNSYHMLSKPRHLSLQKEINGYPTQLDIPGHTSAPLLAQRDAVTPQFYRSMME